MKSFLKYWLTDTKNPKKYLFDIGLTILIMISILLVLLEHTQNSLSQNLRYLDNTILIFFTLEYLARLYICSDFRKDCNTKGYGYAIQQKVVWMWQISSIIDLLAIIPVLNYFRTFRVLRYLRLLRVIKLFKVWTIIQDIHKLVIILKGMREENRIFYIFFGATATLLLLISFVLYLVENNTENTTFNSFKDTVWYVFAILELADDTPSTVTGKLLSILLLFSNMAIFGVFISIISNKIKHIMDAVTSGKIKLPKIKNHTILCGYTKSSQAVIKDLLKDKRNHNKVVLITTQEIEDISGLIYINADYTESQTLEKVSIHQAKNAIVFSEANQNDTPRDIDLRTVMTVFHIEKMAPNVHTIAEINDQKNAEIIRDKINGDEIIYKELIDAKIISNCIRNPNISNLFYAFFGDQKERIQSTTLAELKITEAVTVKKMRDYFINKNKTFLEFIDARNTSHLSPDNEIFIDVDSQLIYLS